jgi:hypothetical protein
MPMFATLGDVQMKSMLLFASIAFAAIPASAQNGPVKKDGSGGFVHAPSQSHAAPAAVLRSGYLNSQSPTAKPKREEGGNTGSEGSKVSRKPDDPKGENKRKK